MLISKGNQHPRGALQLSQIARPGIVQEKSLHLRAQFWNGPAKLLAILEQKMFHQAQDVFLSLPQGRQTQAYPANPVIEILAQPSGFDLDFEVARTAADKSRRHIPRSVSAGPSQQDLSKKRLGCGTEIR